MALFRFILFATFSMMVACSTPEDLYLLPAPAKTNASIKVRPKTVEVRDVSLPSYAEEADILVRHTDGALRPIDGALWANDPQKGITQAIARRLDAGTTATVTPEPWPLFDGPDRSVEITIERMVATAGKTLEIEGQFAILSRTGEAREFVRRFEVVEFLPDGSANAVAGAMGLGLGTLSDQIAKALK
ncbi:MAG: PqiC family protein [Pseudomonadota bacterium]